MNQIAALTKAKQRDSPPSLPLVLASLTADGFRPTVMINFGATPNWLSLPFIPSCLPTTARLSGTDIILSSGFCNRPWARSSRCLFHRLVPANLCKGMRMPAVSTSPQRGIDRIRAGVVRPRGVRNDDADRRPWARKRPFRTRPAERVVHPVCPCRSTSGSLNRDNSRGMSQECAANAVR